MTTQAPDTPLLEVSRFLPMLLALADLEPQQAGSGNSLMAVNRQLSIGFGIAFGAAMLRYFSHAAVLHENVQNAICVSLTAFPKSILSYI